MKISLSHGSGGRAMQSLIKDVLLKHFDAPELQALEDCATLEAGQGRLAMSTDSFVVDPLEFPGGDIGCLAVYGSVNDLAVGGAIPRYLSFSLILEEGLPLEVLQRVVASAAQAAKQVGVRIVTGDTKVVPRGAADKIFINTTAVGWIEQAATPSIHTAREGDVVLLSGDMGRHGAAIVAAREDLHLNCDIQSDCGDLLPLCQAILQACPETSCLRDATRGGVATVLNEIAEASQQGIQIEESALPLEPSVRGLCELLGLDPLYLACEGRLLALVPESAADAVLAAMRAVPMGAGACRIGQVGTNLAGRVSMKSEFGGERIVDMLLGEQLPRIC